VSFSLESLECDLRACVAAVPARVAAIWAELHAMFADQERRAREEHERRAAEDERERQLRAELVELEGGDPNADPLEGLW